MIKYKKGFTLIELLVVIAIISLLSSVVLTSLNSARSKARDTKRRAELRQLSVALELYYNKYGTYPISSPNCGGQSGDEWCRDNQGDNWVPGLSEFIPMPHSPPVASGWWGYHYYGYSSTQYWLMVKLENVSTDTCGSATYMWFDGVTEWCATNPSNNNAVYIISQR